MLLLTVFLGLLISAYGAEPLTDVNNQVGICPSSWTYYNATGYCYAVFNNLNLNWGDSEKKCLQEGSHLASIHSEKESVFVAELAKPFSQLIHHWHGQTFIGFFTTDKGQTWQWTDKTPTDYLRWNTFAPDKLDIEHCGQIWSSILFHDAKPVPDTQSYAELYNTLVPEVFCRDLVRIGFIGDGGKWICNPLSVQSLQNCVVYSLGINGEPSFEESFQNFTQKKCVVRSVDKDAQNSRTMERITAANGIFMKALIASKTDELQNRYILKDILHKFGDKRVDVLKIDIEGAEFDIQDELISVPICQLLIEIHGKSAKQTLQLLQKFSSNGFYLFSYEINGGNILCSEYSFIHQDCFKDYGIKTIYGKYLS